MNDVTIDTTELAVVEAPALVPVLDADGNPVLVQVEDKATEVETAAS